MRKILVTGAAGFIGFHFARELLKLGYKVVGIDNLNAYYSTTLKRDRLKQIEHFSNFEFEKLDFSDSRDVASLFAKQLFDCVVHLGAQAGVRYSIENPMAYIDANVIGTMNILEGCRHNRVAHLIYASSSSVYGNNTLQPFSVHHNVDHPISLYAATKKSNELMAHTYSHLYGLPTTGLRFFTVYGPWGRPDMALYKFTKAIIEDKPIDIYNEGKMQRDFTYVDDIVTSMIKLITHIPKSDCHVSTDTPDPATSTAPYRLYNIGNHSPTELLYFVECIEMALGKKAIRNMLPMQPGDVPSTYADVTDLEREIGFAPSTPIRQGVQNFVDWYREYHQCT